MTAVAPYRSQYQSPGIPGRDSFAQALRAEWTKFRTVRGWVIGTLVAALAMAGVGLLASGGGRSACQAVGVGANGQPESGSGSSCQPSFLLGPDGEPVADSFYFVRQPLAGDGSITVRVTSMTGLLPPDNPDNGAGPFDSVHGVEPWAKAGLIVKENLSQGSAYAAIMVAADHGVRLQWNYTGDTAGLPGTVGPANPRWLRLTRSGDVITGYDSADGTHWTRVGAVTLTGLPATAQVGLFTASPEHNQMSANFGGGVSGRGGPTRDTAVFDHLATADGWTTGPWTGQYVGQPEIPGVVGYHQSGGQYTLTGQGNIAPVPAGHGGPADAAATVTDYLLGTFVGLIALVVVAGLFVTSEYRRGLIRLTFAATPSRGRVLAAKSVVVAVVGFVAGLVGAAAAVLAGEAITRARGYYPFPISGTAEARVIVGTAVLTAVASVLALAIGAIVRRGAATVAVIIVVIVIPYFLAATAALPLGAGDWLLRIAPAAGFALQQPYPAYNQVSMLYSPFSGYFPLAPLAGLGVLAAWTAAALALAAYRLCRRDA
ncbi:MAG TPA: ABC transporter permease subunit [Trebonia sp.]|jgi:ABC-type transport system involved in multi-copper enzyme maturation permease subunit